MYFAGIPMDDQIFIRIKELSDPYFKLAAHSSFHTERVFSLSLRIGIEEKADLQVLKAAALLHDVARTLEDEGKIEDHAIEGAKIARRILKIVGFPIEKIEEVVHCVEVHRFSKSSKTHSLEAKIIQDADRLDLLGAIGISRVFATGGWVNMPIYDPSISPKKQYDGKSLTSINHIYEKLLSAKNKFNTSFAKKMAQERYAFVEEFLDRFMKEWTGEL